MTHLRKKYNLQNIKTPGITKEYIFFQLLCTGLNLGLLFCYRNLHVLGRNYAYGSTTNHVLNRHHKYNVPYLCRLFFLWRSSPKWAYSASSLRFSRLHTHTHTHSRQDSSERVIRSSKLPLPTKHTTNTRDEEPCP